MSTACDRTFFGEVYPVDCPVFSGADGEDVEEFCDKFRACAKLDGWSDSDQRLRLSLCLRGHALSWFRFMSQHDEAATTDDVLRELCDFFFPPIRVFEAKMQLHKLVQRQDETVLSYAVEFACLARKSRCGYSDKQLADLFLIGLLPHLRQPVLLQLFMRSSEYTYTDVVRASRTAEACLELEHSAPFELRKPQPLLPATAQPEGATLIKPLCAPADHAADAEASLTKSKPRKPCPRCNGPHWSSRCPLKKLPKMLTPDDE